MLAFKLLRTLATPRLFQTFINTFQNSMDMTWGQQRNWICSARGVNNFGLLPPEVELQTQGSQTLFTESAQVRSSQSHARPREIPVEHGKNSPQ